MAINKTFSVRHGIDVANTIIFDSTRNLSNIANANVITVNATNFVTTSGLNLPNHTNNAYAAANSAANTVRISQNSGSTLSAKQLNFVNTSSILISISDSGDGNANIILTTSGASAADAYNQANAAYSVANNAADTVRVSQNSTISFPGRKINFVNTSTISVNITDAGDGNANIALSSSGSGVAYQYNTNSSSAETVDSWNKYQHRSVKYIIQATSSLGYHSCEVAIIHDGVSSNIAQYGNVFIGANPIVSYSSDISGNNARLRVVASDPTTRIKYYKSEFANDVAADPETLPTDLFTQDEVYDLMNLLYLIPTDLNA